MINPGIFITEHQIVLAENHDLNDLFTPVNGVVFGQLLQNVGYESEKTQFIVNGFQNGFNLEYTGNRKLQLTSPNLRFLIGNETVLWNKVMAEVQAKRVAGPYDRPPFENFIQSPLGLVPKDKGAKTRLIFHLSHPRDGTTSVNFNTPKQKCTVKYSDFDDAIRLCIQEGKGCKAGKSDLTSAFRHLCIRKQDWMLLVMMAIHPVTKEKKYFVDKCLPFGHALSCALFQKISDAISFLVKYRTRKDNISYLDDFFFVCLIRALCNDQITQFIDICDLIKFPVSMDKTYWATTKIVFLGLLIDTANQWVSIPCEKIVNILSLIKRIMACKRRKLTLNELQQVCGHLNFICKSVIPGRPFTRRLYMFMSGCKKLHHHIYIHREMREDLAMWEQFLEHPTVYARPFLDFTKVLTAEEVNMYSDASRNYHLGAGGYCGKSWFAMTWDMQFMQQYNPSIAYLELYALVVTVLNWIHRFTNQRIILFCDNKSVIDMVNHNTAHCKHCLKLIRVLCAAQYDTPMCVYLLNMLSQRITWQQICYPEIN